MKTKMIVVLGPTAVGKTALGIELAQKYDGEIISGDSQQVYKHLDIGTAKASRAEQEAVKHHLIDVREVWENYSVYDFVQEAQAAIADIERRGKLPIIVGGTGLYLQSLLEGYHLGGQVDQPQLLAYRAELERLDDAAIYQLAEQAQLKIKEINRRRAIRALELAKFGQEMNNAGQPYDALLIGLTDERQLLYDRINARVEVMMAQGLETEARWLYQNYPNAQASLGIGYKEFYPYFAGDISLETAVAQVKQNTRRFAKRQLTWYRNRMHIDFYPVGQMGNKEKIFKDVEAFLDHD